MHDYAGVGSSGCKETTFAGADGVAIKFKN